MTDDEVARLGSGHTSEVGLPAVNEEQTQEANTLRAWEVVSNIATDAQREDVRRLVYTGSDLRKAASRVLGQGRTLLPAPGKGDGTSDAKGAERSKRDDSGTTRTLDIA